MSWSNANSSKLYKLYTMEGEWSAFSRQSFNTLSREHSFTKGLLYKGKQEWREASL